MLAEPADGRRVHRVEVEAVRVEETNDAFAIGGCVEPGGCGRGRRARRADRHGRVARVGHAEDLLAGRGEYDRGGHKVDEQRHLNEQRHDRKEERGEDAGGRPARLAYELNGETQALEQRQQHEQDEGEQHGGHNARYQPRGRQRRDVVVLAGEVGCERCARQVGQVHGAAHARAHVARLATVEAHVAIEAVVGGKAEAGNHGHTAEVDERSNHPTHHEYVQKADHGGYHEQQGDEIRRRQKILENVLSLLEKENKTTRIYNAILCVIAAYHSIISARNYQFRVR